MTCMLSVTHYCLQMYLKTLEISVIIYGLKKAGVNLELSRDICMLLKVGSGIRDGICQAAHRYAKANKKYMDNYDKDVESSYTEHLDTNNLYGWAMLQKLPVNFLKQVEELSKFDEVFIKKYNENSNIGYFFEVDVEHPQKLLNLLKNFQFFPERKRIRGIQKLICRIEVKKSIQFT